METGKFSNFYVESCLQPRSSSFAEKEETEEVYQYSFQENKKTSVTVRLAASMYPCAHLREPFVVQVQALV